MVWFQHQKSYSIYRSFTLYTKSLFNCFHRPLQNPSGVMHKCICSYRSDHHSDCLHFFLRLPECPFLGLVGIVDYSPIYYLLQPERLASEFFMFLQGVYSNNLYFWKNYWETWSYLGDLPSILGMSNILRGAIKFSDNLMAHLFLQNFWIVF